MNKMVRAFVALVSFALCSALFAGSADVYVDSGQSINISIGGTTDGSITITNLDTNQVVADASAYTTYGGYYGYSYYYYGSGYLSGVSVSYSGEISGLPAGNYRITASGPYFMSDFSANSWGSSAQISLYSPYYGSEWMDFYFNIY